MTHEAAVLKAQEIASSVLAPAAEQNDTAARFSTEAVRSLGESGLLGLLLPVDVGGAGLGSTDLCRRDSNACRGRCFCRDGLRYAHLRHLQVYRQHAPLQRRPLTSDTARDCCWSSFIYTRFQRSWFTESLLGASLTRTAEW
jgi:alkylation response protein AidB-like acyl-CoA dehydrogenase